ncbi:hypothetical protein [Halostella litorea]|uniref:hypothetical protein n=1 Tax=Halostella litorea TaxID=2528831 RepID=UPI001091984E|nr:hypothetical protein [Halostella litorea]
MAADLDDLPAMIDRLERAARDRWGDEWRIETTRYADGTAEATVIHSRGLVDPDADAGEQLHEQERLETDGEGRVLYERVHYRHGTTVDVREQEMIVDLTDA